ncbi:MAG: ABC transporter ATP-binding protein, partial [Chloroflexota bacterium]
KDIGVNFGGIQAVKAVTLDILTGERHAILGPNGAGKTSLFNLIAGEYKATSGSVMMFGEDVTRKPIHLRSRMGLGRTYQTSALFPQLSVLDHLYLAIRGCYRGRMSFLPIGRNQATRSAAIELAEKVGLIDRIDQTVADLAHGQQRQLEVGLALAGNPRLILLDEPAAGLSQGERVELVQLLKRLENHLTVLIIEHDMDVALEVADMITVMHDGRSIATDTPDSIAHNQQIHDLYLGKSDA